MKTLEFDKHTKGKVVGDSEWKRLAVGLRPPPETLRLVGDGSVTVEGAVVPPVGNGPSFPWQTDQRRMTYGVGLENHGATEETIHVSRSLAYPAGTFLQLDLRGANIGTRGIHGPEVHGAMGKVEARRFVVAPQTTLRFTATIPLGLVQYEGSPACELHWQIHINDAPMSGTLTISLPPSPA
jgi:hypothetical protein